MAAAHRENVLSIIARDAKLPKSAGRSPWKSQFETRHAAVSPEAHKRLVEVAEELGVSAFEAINLTVLKLLDVEALKPHVKSKALSRAQLIKRPSGKLKNVRPEEIEKLVTRFEDGSES